MKKLKSALSVMVFTLMIMLFSCSYTFSQVETGVGNWRYLSLADPGMSPWLIDDFIDPPGWEDPAHPDATWDTDIVVLPGMFFGVNSMWVDETGGQVHGALFRTDFNLTEVNSIYWMNIYSNNFSEVYINGNQIGGTYLHPTSYTDICVPSEFLREGENIVAIKVTEYTDAATLFAFSLTREATLSATIGNACLGNNGWIDLTVTNGTGPLSYSWTGPGLGINPTTEDINSLSPGTYTVTVTDGNGCSVTQSYIVPLNSAPISIFIDSVNCSSLPIQLPGYNDPDIVFSASPPLDPAAISPIGLFDPQIAGPGTWIVHQTVTDNNGCTVSNYIHIQVYKDASFSIDLGIIDCFSEPILLPGAGNPDITFSVVPPLDATAITGDGMFIPGNAGVGSWLINQTIGSGPCAITNFIHVEVPDFEEFVEISLDYFCAGEDIYYTIPGGGTFEVILDPEGDAPYPVSDGIISQANGYGLGSWEIKQVITTPGGCTVEKIYSFEIVGNCTCFPDITLTYTENPDNCSIYDFTGSIDYNGTFPSHWRWTISDTSLSQIIDEAYGPSPWLNSDHDLSLLPIQVSGPQTVCFELWSYFPDQPGVLSYCKICFEIDLCVPPITPIEPQGLWVNATDSQENKKTSVKVSINEPIAVPNPTSGIVQLKGINGASEISIKVYNAIGKVIINKQLYDQQIDLSDQPNGIYFVEVFGKDETFVIKLLKE